jgi:predicted exporter
MKPNALSRPVHHDADRRLRYIWRWLALAWLLVTVAVVAYQWRFWQQNRIDNDVLALLPLDTGERTLNDVTRRIAESSTQQIVVLLGATTPEGAKAAEAAYLTELDRLRASDPVAVPFAPSGLSKDWFAQAQAFYAPYRDRLLTEVQRNTLATANPEQLAQQTLAALYGPLGAPRLTEWRADPLSLWSGWWQQRAAGSGLRIGADGLLNAEGRYWTVLPLEMSAPAFRLDGNTRIQDALDAAAQATRTATPGAREVRAGVPLHAEAAAARAHWEINIIGWGSLAAVLLLAWLAFGSLWPRLLVIVSLLVGCLVALSVTAWVFGKVHLLTLVFGASLMGVAEDYGTYWFAARQGNRADTHWALLRRLWPGLCLALATSALAYLAMGLVPFPGLRQMAVFSAVGLTAAFVTVLCWFPWLSRSARPDTAFARWVETTLRFFPRVSKSWQWYAAGALALAAIAAGLWQLRIDDSLRSLQASPHQLIAQQIEASRILDLPSPAQFFLIQGDNAEQVLQREEALTSRLRTLQAQDRITGWRALSDWLPSQRRQTQDAALTAKVERAVLGQVGAAVGQPLQRATFAAQPLLLSEFLAAPVSRPVRSLWIGKLDNQVASVVMIAGLSTATLDVVRAQADNLPGVRWVDRTADFSHLLGHYRKIMTNLLLVSVAVVFIVLAVRYRRNAWRVLLPTVLAGLLALAVLGWIGEPLQLFNVLALLLLLGVGVDYAIFLIEQDDAPHAWLAVCLGAASTSLSFGLLGLSATPALHAFGLTLLLGIGAVWLLSPLLCRPIVQTDSQHGGNNDLKN